MSNKNMGNVDTLLKLSSDESFMMKHDYIGTEHILLGFMKLNSKDTEMLMEAGANYDKLKQVVINSIGYGNEIKPPENLTPRVKRLMEKSREVARDLGSNFIGTEHILLALLEDDDSFSGYMLNSTSVNKDKIKKELKE